MNKQHLMAAGLLGTLTLMPGCTAQKPKEFKELASEVAKNQDLRAAASKSDLIITVTIDNEHRVFLGNERVGTAEEVGPLKEKLVQALERREKAYQVGATGATPDSNERPGRRVIFVRAPSSFKYGEVVKVLEAIKAAGGEPVGVQDSEANQ